MIKTTIAHIARQIITIGYMHCTYMQSTIVIILRFFLIASTHSLKLTLMEPQEKAADLVLLKMSLGFLPDLHVKGFVS